MERRYKKEYKYLEKITAYDSDTTLKDLIRVFQAKLKQYSKEYPGYVIEVDDEWESSGIEIYATLYYKSEQEYLDHQEELKRKRAESEEKKEKDLYEKLKQKFNPS
jgi:hypothetical protein